MIDALGKYGLQIEGCFISKTYLKILELLLNKIKDCFRNFHFNFIILLTFLKIH